MVATPDTHERLRVVERYHKPRLGMWQIEIGSFGEALTEMQNGKGRCGGRVGGLYHQPTTGSKAPVRPSNHMSGKHGELSDSLHLLVICCNTYLTNDIASRWLVGGIEFSGGEGHSHVVEQYRNVLTRDDLQFMHVAHRVRRRCPIRLHFRSRKFLFSLYCAMRKEICLP